MRIGSIEVEQVIDAMATVDPVAIWTPAAGAGGASKGDRAADWVQHQVLLRPDGRLDMPVGAFLVRTGGRLLLVDLGYGPHPPNGMAGGRLLASLARIDVAPGDITDVVFSHLHPDHVGWATTDGLPTFPNARYRCHRDDWDHFVTSGAVPTVAARLAPLADRMERWGSDHTVAPGVDLVAAPGHTPGNAYVVLSSGLDRGFLLGDIVHCPVELVDDEWAGLGDVDPSLARRVRMALALELEGSGSMVAAAHFPGMSFGRLLTGEGTRSWRWS
jgi:glyoxylase-like metal-dependent hydrolase (beta-lactamase superfamily II)